MRRWGTLPASKSRGSPARLRCRPALIRCKSPLHERNERVGMSWSGRGAGRAARLSSRQSARGADPGRARPDRQEGAGRVHLCRRGALGRGQLGRALPAFPRPRRADRRCRAARLRAVRRASRPRLGRRPARALRRLRERRPRLSRLCPRRARLLFGDVRGRAVLRRRSGVAPGRRPQLCGVAPRLGDAVRAPAARKSGRRR